MVVGGGWWLAIGGWWRLAVVGSWWLVAAGGWRRLVVGGWWRLAVDGSWRLAVGGPLGRSLRAVLKQKKKKSGSLKTALGLALARPLGPVLHARMEQATTPPQRVHQGSHLHPQNHVHQRLQSKTRKVVVAVHFGVDVQGLDPVHVGEGGLLEDGVGVDEMDHRVGGHVLVHRHA